MANILATIAPELCGFIRTRYVRCGKPGCKCSTGEGHGPYYHLQFRRYKDGRGWVTANRYISKGDVEQVRAELAEARQFTKQAIKQRQNELKARANLLASVIQEELLHAKETQSD